MSRKVRNHKRERLQRLHETNGATEMPKFNGKKYVTTVQIVVHDIDEDNSLMVHQIVETQIRGNMAKNEIIHSVIGKGIGDETSNDMIVVLLAALTAEVKLFDDFLEFAEKDQGEKEAMLRELLERVIKGMHGESDDMVKEDGR